MNAISKTRLSLIRQLLTKMPRGTLLLLLLFPLASSAQNPQWQAMKTQQLFTFDIDCAEKASFPQKALGDVVRRVMPAKHQNDQQAYGNLAVALKLNKPGATVFFIPTICGPADCTWLLYTIGPVKSLGEIKDKSIITYQSSNEMPTIVATSVVDTFTTAFSTYSYDIAAAQYESLGDRQLYEVDKDDKVVEGGSKIPIFFRKPKVLMPQCKNMIQ
jgi:hypothetical protein